MAVSGRPGPECALVISNPGPMRACTILPLLHRGLFSSRTAGMPFLPRKGILAIAAVVDIALNDRERPVSAKTLAVRHGLPPRHLEPVLQALVRDGILKGTRGPRGGYALARESGRITA